MSATPAATTPAAPMKAIDALRNRLRAQEHAAKEALTWATTKLRIVAALDSLPLPERIDFTADLADYYAEIDPRPAEPGEEA